LVAYNRIKLGEQEQQKNPAGAETQAGRQNIQANLNASLATAFYHGSPQSKEARPWRTF
jgi:hypothetical protein